MSQYSKYNPTGARIPPVPFTQPKGLYRFGEQSIWSTHLFVGGAALASTSNRLFSIAQGSTGQGFGAALSIAETNLKEAGRVPNGVAYDVFGVACQVMHMDQNTDVGDFDVPADTQVLIADLVNVINNGVLRWNFTQTSIDIAPVCLVGAGGGAFGAVAQNAAGANSGNMNNGNGHIWMYRKHPVALPGSTTFTVLLDFGTRAAPVSAANCLGVRVTLLGYYKNIIEIG